MRTCAGPPEVLTAAPLPVPNILSHARIESIAANYTVSILSPKESPVGAGGFILGQPVVTPEEHIIHGHPDRIAPVLILRKLRMVDPVALRRSGSGVTAARPAQPRDSRERGEIRLRKPRHADKSGDRRYQHDCERT